MINSKDHPVGWDLLFCELEEAHEHLGSLLKDISTNAEYSEESFRIDLGHVYAHLNRAWRRRHVREDMTEAEWSAGREFPSDIQPIA